MQTASLLISAILQAFLFAIIPVVWWFICCRKQTSFFHWIGLKRPVIGDKTKFTLVFVLAIVLFFIPSLVVIPFFIGDAVVATSQFAGQGAAAIVPALIFSFLQTGFSEELFFRGFLTKRQIKRFGFSVGNFIQGALFGLMHGVLLGPVVSTWGTVFIVLLTGGVGWLMGWMNEKQAGGSIIPSWMLHGVTNMIASILAMFSIGL